MIIEQINSSARDSFQLSLDKFSKSFAKRGVSFIVLAHSEFVGQITILVTGKRGTAEKTIVLVYNQKTLEWEAYCDGYLFKMLALNEISSVIKSHISKLSTLLLKI